MVISIKLTALLDPDPAGGFTALCPELDVASQGETEDVAEANLREAVELFLETASEAEVRQRYRSGFKVRSLEVSHAA